MLVEEYYDFFVLVQWSTKLMLRNYRSFCDVVENIKLSVSFLWVNRVAIKEL